MLVSIWKNLALRLPMDTPNETEQLFAPIAVEVELLAREPTETL
jgi:hypothetical protein